MANTILDKLEQFLNMRPGLEPENYGGDISLYRQDYRENCYRPLQDGRKLIAAVRWRDITDEDIIRASRTAFSGRLEVSHERIDYTPGQYGPAEFRHAVCAVLASALWNYFCRDWTGPLESGRELRDYVRRSLKHELGRGTVSRYID